MDAPLVRAYLDALPELPPDGRSIERTRVSLETLQRPDIRYLVATVLGPGAGGIARVAAAVLAAAGARTAVLGRSFEDTTLNAGPIDDALLAHAGTLAAAAGYQLAEVRPDLGEITRREAFVVLALVAFAADQRVALLVDEDVRPADPMHAPLPDLVVLGDVHGAALDAALALVPQGRPVVLGSDDAAVRARARERLAGAPILVGGRDHRAEERDGRLAVLIRDEPYVTVDPVEGLEPWQVSAGVAASLALGLMGIRMREEWVISGLASLRRETVAP